MDTIVEYSSGSTAISLSVIARILYGIEDTRAFLSNKTSEARLRLMRFFGLRIFLFGGPSQPEPSDPRGGIQKAREMAQASPSVFNPDQYENELNCDAHERWTGPQILDQLPEIDVFCTGLGTSGTMTGTGTFLKQKKPSVIRVGVCTAVGDHLPGPRSYPLLAPVHFPPREAVDVVKDVDSRDSYRMSMLLSRQGIICGPSSGVSFQGLLEYLHKCKIDGTLCDLIAHNAKGELHCVFLCCDLPYQHIDDYFDNVDGDEFLPIVNRNLIGVDKYRYDDSWELSQFRVAEKLYGSSIGLDHLLPSDSVIKENVNPPGSGSESSACLTSPSTTEDSPQPSLMDDATMSCTLKPDTILLDLRKPGSFNICHLPGATNNSLTSLDSTTPPPFSNSDILESQWRELDTLCQNGLADQLKANHRTVVLVDYDGDTARIATSVLQASGTRAWSLQNGMRGLGVGTSPPSM